VAQETPYGEKIMNDPLEVEVKYLITDPLSIRNSIIDAGWPSMGRHFETNLRFDNADRGLLGKKQLLRLRSDVKTTLTFKSKAPVDVPGYKVQRELEVTVSDFDTMKAIIEALGFCKEQVYEKWRETFRAGNAEICLDEMPFASFIEIEGTKTEIDAISETLGFKSSRVITANYLEIFEKIRDRFNLPFTDVTFDDFSRYPADYTEVVRSFEAEHLKR
jgi:adenylate cyclase class 2